MFLQGHRRRRQGRRAPRSSSTASAPADTHHAITPSRWGPDGALYFQEGTFHHTQVETPYGPARVRRRRRLPLRAADREVRRLRLLRLRQPVGPRLRPLGPELRRRRLRRLQLLRHRRSPATSTTRTSTKPMQELRSRSVRPTRGCEFVSQPALPRRRPGQLPVNNVIGFQGILQYQSRGRRLGLRRRPRSSRSCSRPTRTSARSTWSSGPTARSTSSTGSTRSIGHMQHSLRDPSRDTIARPHLADHRQGPAAGRRRRRSPARPIAQLLDLLKAYEDRTRYQARLALRDRPTER